MRQKLNYIFLCHQLDKYERLIAEAKTIEMEKFCVEQWKFYNTKYQQFKQCANSLS